ncbi:MAG: hypothetical protein ACUVQX_06685 [Candidatus Bathycorpusculaceae bacterium]
MNSFEKDKGCEAVLAAANHFSAVEFFAPIKKFLILRQNPEPSAFADKKIFRTI